MNTNLEQTNLQLIDYSYKDIIAKSKGNLKSISWYFYIPMILVICSAITMIFALSSSRYPSYHFIYISSTFGLWLAVSLCSLGVQRIALKRSRCQDASWSDFYRMDDVFAKYFSLQLIFLPLYIFSLPLLRLFFDLAFYVNSVAFEIISLLFYVSVVVGSWIFCSIAQYVGYNIIYHKKSLFHVYKSAISGFFTQWWKATFRLPFSIFRNTLAIRWWVTLILGLLFLSFVLPTVSAVLSLIACIFFVSRATMLSNLALVLIFLQNGQKTVDDAISNTIESNVSALPLDHAKISLITSDLEEVSLQLIDYSYRDIIKKAKEIRTGIKGRFYVPVFLVVCLAFFGPFVLAAYHDSDLYSDFLPHNHPEISVWWRLGLWFIVSLCSLGMKRIILKHLVDVKGKWSDFYRIDRVSAQYLLLQLVFIPIYIFFPYIDELVIKIIDFTNNLLTNAFNLQPNISLYLTSSVVVIFCITVPVTLWIIRSVINSICYSMILQDKSLFHVYKGAINNFCEQWRTITIRLPLELFLGNVRAIIWWLGILFTVIFMQYIMIILAIFLATIIFAPLILLPSFLFFLGARVLIFSDIALALILLQGEQKIASASTYDTP